MRFLNQKLEEFVVCAIYNLQKINVQNAKILFAPNVCGDQLLVLFVRVN
jgi:hypothetical protein